TEVHGSGGRKSSQPDTGREPRLGPKMPFPGMAGSGFEAKRGRAQRARDVNDVAWPGAGACERFASRYAAAAHDIDDDLIEARKITACQCDVRFPGEN